MGLVSCSGLSVGSPQEAIYPMPEGTRQGLSCEGRSASSQPGSGHPGCAKGHGTFSRPSNCLSNCLSRGLSPHSPRAPEAF